MAMFLGMCHGMHEQHLREYEAFVQNINVTGMPYRDFLEMPWEKKEQAYLNHCNKYKESAAKMKRLASAEQAMNPAIDNPELAQVSLSWEEWSSKNLTYLNAFNTSSPTFWEFWSSPIHESYKYKCGPGVYSPKSNTLRTVILFAINKRLKELDLGYYATNEVLGHGGSKTAVAAYRWDDPEKKNKYVLRYSFGYGMYRELVLAEKFRKDIPWADEVIAKSYCCGNIMMKEELADFCPDPQDNVTCKHVSWEIMERVLSFDRHQRNFDENKKKIEGILKRNYSGAAVLEQHSWGFTEIAPAGKFIYGPEVYRVFKELQTVRRKSNWSMMDDKIRQCGFPRGCSYAVTYDLDFMAPPGHCKGCGFEKPDMFAVCTHCTEAYEVNCPAYKSWTRVTLIPEEDPNPRPDKGKDAKRKSIQ